MAAIRYLGSPCCFTKLSPVDTRESVYTMKYNNGLGLLRGKYVPAIGHVWLHYETRIGVPYHGIRSLTYHPRGKYGNPKFQVSAFSSDNRFGGGNDWMGKVSSEVVHQLLNTHPYLRDVVVLVGGTLVGTLLAWKMLPKFLKRLHVLSSAISFWKHVSYEESIFGALQAPIQYIIAFVALSQICVLVAPSIIASQRIAPAWKCATTIAICLVLHQWKTNVIKRALTRENLDEVDRKNWLSLNGDLSIGLFAIGWMVSAEAFGATQRFILTTGYMVFACRDVLWHILQSLSIWISAPFSVGDWLKAGSVEGEVLDIGFASTTLLTAEKTLVHIPNSFLFESAVSSTNESRKIIQN